MSHLYGAAHGAVPDILRPLSLLHVRACRGRLLASGEEQCPECREPHILKDARLNKHLQRQVNGLKVRCQHYDVGCEWVGELRYLQQHLDPETRKCGFILLPCPLGCGELIRSYLKKEHMRNDCLNRSCVCEHCGYYNKHDIVTEMHYPLCELFPVECPNECSVRNLKRIQFEMHLKQCPLQVIECPFSSAGCTVQLPRREMEAHEDMAMRQHLHMVMSLLQSKPTQEPSSPSPSTNHSQYRFSLPPVEFTIMDFLKMKESDAEWISPPFYTHPHGYKLCLVVYPNGVYYGKGTHVSVFVGLMKGEHDDQLNWPVEVDVAVELLNWKEDKGHCERTLTMNSEYYRVTQKGGIKLSPTNIQFIHHSLLSLNTTTNTEYLLDDCLWLRVCAAIVNLTPETLLIKTPSWQDPHSVSQSACEFTMPEFSKRKKSNNTFYSPPFYTHQGGYKLCLKVHANGITTSKSTHISVHVQLMAGDNDDRLHWPFTGDIVIELLNWREDKGHHQKTISLMNSNDDAINFYQVTDGTVGLALGWPEFFSQSSLSYNRTTNTEYVQNDCLRLRVRMIAVYSPTHLVKTPSWQQDPHNVSQSVCEFTLSELSKRKQLNNQFYSPPFYTHQHGYKLCISIIF